VALVVLEGSMCCLYDVLLTFHAACVWLQAWHPRQQHISIASCRLDWRLALTFDY